MTLQAFGFKSAVAVAATLAVSAVVTSANPVHAALIAGQPLDVTITSGNSSTQSSTGVIDFEGADTPPGQILQVPDGYTVANGDAVLFKQSGNVRVRPNNTALNQFLDVTNGSATLTFNNSLAYFGFFWRDINNNNLISFFKDNDTIAAYTGAEIKSAFGLTGSPSQYVNFFANPLGIRFNRVEFSDPAGNDPRGFEIDNVAYRVPTPALLPGLLGLGVAALRKRKAQATEKASAEV